MSKAAVGWLALACSIGLSGCRPKPMNPPSKRPATLATATAQAEAHSHAHTNRLAAEKSPYLLQHQFNPVDWYAWGPEAFAKARAEHKPIFLSIGYSTCHWCHVMERESFENDDTAAFLNAHFISIKVDREERPDVDKIYMTFVQATTGSGGWPLNVFLTPDLKPFYGGTYFPPDNRYGRGSFMEVLRQVDQAWRERHTEISNSAEKMRARLEEAASSMTLSNILLTTDTLRRAGSMLKQMYDPRHGGFGGAPKFPQPSQPVFLLRYAHRFNDADAAKMVLNTCDHMAAGGIHDQLGGGFARYSVDAEWLVPHFEKMLYDNAQLAQLYLDAYVYGGEQRYADVVRDILHYVLRDMTHPQAGFYSAEDADSEGHEGKFYCWTRQELSELLSPPEFKAVVRYFGVTEKGNFIDHSHPTPLPNQNVLSVVDPKMPAGERELVESAKKKMFEVRSKRVRPHLDDKVLVSWNGLMLGAMARAGAVLGESEFTKAAVKNAEFLKAKLWQPPGGKPSKEKGGAGTLYHRWRDGERDSVQLFEGYAFLMSGLVELYESTLDPQYLEFAINLAEAMVEKFYDSENGGFWQSAADSNDLILRSKEDYDGAEPSGNSVAVLGLLKLGKITGRDDLTKAAEKTLRLFAERLQQTPQAVPFMLQALDFSMEEPRRAVIAGETVGRPAESLLRAVHGVYQPNKVVLGTDGPVEEFARSLPATNGLVVYVCTGTACKPPTKDAEKVREFMR